MGLGDALATRGMIGDFVNVGIIESFTDAIATRGHVNLLHNTIVFQVMKTTISGKQATLAFEGKRAQITIAKVDC